MSPARLGQQADSVIQYFPRLLMVETVAVGLPTECRGSLRGVETTLLPTQRT